RETLRIVKAIGVDADAIANVRLAVGDAVAGRAFASGRAMMTGGDGTPRPAQDGVYESDAFVSMPILASNHARQVSVGVLNITNRYGDRPFEEWELEFIDLLGGIAGSIIDDATWRDARESILKFERDLQVARRIQQNTLPGRLPTLAGFDVAAWSEPAEETGGDSYDVIGFRANADGVIELTADEPTHAMLLLADATGHGIGPALSVTQVRAMVRMAVRLRADLSSVVRHLNEQLAADLPRGRFITAWFGEIDAARGTLAAFSAGQGPVLHYDARRAVIRSVPADAAPLGIVPDLEIPPPAPRRLGPGDVIAVLSDGVVEAMNADGAEFGVGGIESVIRAHHDESGGDILRRLQDRLGDFGDCDRHADDRTALIVKRHG
ncbi:MAG: SpoIIE family protein phosphatase, partial [Phycisphaerales bacterium]|nr:SpoIIE family protein phosphatase [Phycisphaerales bacterium]